MDTKDERSMHDVIQDLYEENYKKMIYMVSKDPVCYSVAEDIVQDSFYEAIRNWERIKWHENLGGWLMETAKYKMMAHKRQINRKAVYEIEDSEAEIECVKNEYGMIELSMVMDDALTFHEKTLFYMYYIEGYSVKEMADFENISEGNFRVKMLRIREKVRIALGEKKKK